MKPLTFESIRNFLKTKKKGNKKDGDSSFKRSDSFKRISIRKSYMDRGRKRAFLRTANSRIVNDHETEGIDNHPCIVAADIEVKNDIFTSATSTATVATTNASTTMSTITDSSLKSSIEASLHRIEAGGTFCFRNKSLQEINELCGAFGDDATTDDERQISRIKSNRAYAFPSKAGSSNRQQPNSNSGSSIKSKVHRSSSMGPAAFSTESRGISVSPSTSHIIQKPIRKNPPNRSNDVPLAVPYNSNDIGIMSQATHTREHRSHSGERRSVNRYEHPQKSAIIHSRGMNGTDRNVTTKLKTRNAAMRRPNNEKTHILQPDVSPVKSCHSNSSRTEPVCTNDSPPVRQQQQSPQRMSSDNDVARVQSLLPMPNLSTGEDTASVCNRTIYNETPSLVTFKTFSNEPSSPYMETSFDVFDPRPMTYSLESARSNVSRTSINCTNVLVTTAVINSQTFRMDKSTTAATSKINAVGESIVIRIPADVDVGAQSPVAKNISSSLLQPQSAPLYGIQWDNDEELDVNGCEPFSPHFSIDRTPLNVQTEIYDERQQSLTESISKEDRTSKNEEDKMSSFESHKKHADMMRHLPYDSSEEHTLEKSFRSLSMMEDEHNRIAHDHNFYFEEPHPETYNDEREVISPDSSIPYPLRVKINPFTQQKEPYSVNLGRVWKQLNLGQDDMSIDASTQRSQHSQSNVKTKNESFKSMSSRDSGFSLTLTKTKNIFRKKPVKRHTRKKKIILSRDAYSRRIMVPHDTTRLKKKRGNMKQPQVTPDSGSFVLPNEIFNQSFYKTFGRFYKNRKCLLDLAATDLDASDDELRSRTGSGIANYKDNEIFMQEFQNFCRRRRFQQQQQQTQAPMSTKKSACDGMNASPTTSAIQSSPYLLMNFDNLLRYEAAGNDDEHFSQEISDLEAFFEEHLKRLKEYYLQKKKLVVHIKEDDLMTARDEIATGSLFVAPTDSLEKMQKTKSKQRLGKQSIIQHMRHNKRCCSPQAQSVNSNSPHSSINMFDFVFPHPDKRGSHSYKPKKRNKFQTQEVREFSSATSSGDNLDYASLEFDQHDDQFTMKKKVFDDADVTGTVPYADINSPSLDYSDYTYGNICSKDIRQRYELAKSLGTKSTDTLQSNDSSLATPPIMPPKIQLASIFPSINRCGTASTDSSQTPRSSNSSSLMAKLALREVCRICLKEQQNAMRVSRQYENDNTNESSGYSRDLAEHTDDNIDDRGLATRMADTEVMMLAPRDDFHDLPSDEFSEKEFIEHSLGGEFCVMCQKLHDECLCNLDRMETLRTTYATPAKRKAGRNFCYCDCTSGVYTSTLRSNSYLSKRQINRIKSRRRLVKNHSTLRRDCHYFKSKC